MLTGVGASIFHSVLKKDHWSKTTNNLVSLGYCVIIAGIDLALKGQFKLSEIVPTFLAVYGSAQAWYTTLFLVTAAEYSAPTTPVVVTPAAAPAAVLPTTNEV